MGKWYFYCDKVAFDSITQGPGFRDDDPLIWVTDYSPTAVAGFKTGRRALSFELFGSTGADSSESLMSPYEGSKRYDKGGLDYCIEIEIDNSKVIRVDNAAKDMKTYNQGSQSALGKWATSFFKDGGERRHTFIVPANVGVTPAMLKKNCRPFNGSGETTSAWCQSNCAPCSNVSGGPTDPYTKKCSKCNLYYCDRHHAINNGLWGGGHMC